MANFESHSVIVASHKAAICNLADNWDETWRRLLKGERAISNAHEIGIDVDFEVPVAAVTGLKRHVQEAPVGLAGAVRLAETVLQQLNHGECSYFYGASNHGESDALWAYIRGVHDGRIDERIRDLHAHLATEPLVHHSRDSLPYDTPRTWSYAACASGLYAVALAVLRLRFDSKQVSVGNRPSAVVLAADALSVIALNGFGKLRAIGTDGCRPFHDNRDGLLIAEGSAGLVLEKKNRAEPGDILIAGIGLTCDTGHGTAPNEKGTYLKRAIAQALKQSAICPDDVDAVIAHGTGTKNNDEAESKALASVFGSRRPTLTSVKGCLGHTMGAAGLFNLLTAAECLTTGLIPPTWSDGSKKMKGLNLVTGTSESIPKIRNVLVLAAGFGGSNAAVILSKSE